VIVNPIEAMFPDMSVVASPPSFDTFNYVNAFAIARYVITASIHILIDMIATVTALILMCVVRVSLGYDKETFTSVLSESSKCYKIFISIAICQVLVSPFLGVAPVTPFIQSTAGILVGSRTGLSAVVCGVLFLVSVPFASPIAAIVPLCATAPVVFVACLPVVQGLRYIDFGSPLRCIPALLAFFLMTLTNSIGVGVSFSYVIMFSVFVFSSDWNLLTPQMVASFSMCAALLLIETGLISTIEGLAGVVGGFALFGIIVGLLIAFPFAGYFYTNSGLVSNSHSNSEGRNNHHPSRAVSSNNSTPASPNRKLSKHLPSSAAEVSIVAPVHSNADEQMKSHEELA